MNVHGHRLRLLLLIVSILSSTFATAVPTQNTSPMTSPPLAFGDNCGNALGVNGVACESSVPVKVSFATLGQDIASVSSAFTPAMVLFSGDERLFSHAALLLRNGTVFTIGDNEFGQLGDGTTISRPGIPVQMDTGAGVASAVFAAGGRTHVHFADGTVKATGRNNYGQLGVGGSSDKQTLTTVPLTNVMQLAAGYVHTVFLLSGGAVRVTGWNSHGQLGTGDQTTLYTPVAPVAEVAVDVVAIAAGVAHTLFLKANGTVFAAGLNEYGALGVARWFCGPQQCVVPVAIAGLSNVTAIAAGGRFSLFLESTGVLKGSGHLGCSTLGSLVYEPLPLPGGEDVIAMSALTGQTVGTSTAMGSIVFKVTNGTLFSTASGCCGATPLQVPFDAGTDIVINGGSRFASFSTADASQRDVYVTGDVRLMGDALGMVTFPTQIDLIHPAPVDVAIELSKTHFLMPNSSVMSMDAETAALTNALGVTDAVSIDANCESTFIISSSGGVSSVGKNNVKQLCVGSTVEQSSPAGVPYVEDALQTSSGCLMSRPHYTHSMILMRNGTVRGCGFGNYGAIGIGTQTQPSIPTDTLLVESAVYISAGADFTLFLLQNSTAMGTGNTYSGQLGTGAVGYILMPIVINSVAACIAIAAGESHSVFVLADGTAKATGMNRYGQLGDGTFTKRMAVVTVQSIANATAVAAGMFHTVFLLADGTVKAVGRNRYGQLGVGDTVDRSIPVVVPSSQGPRNHRTCRIKAGYHRTFLFHCQDARFSVLPEIVLRGAAPVTVDLALAGPVPPGASVTVNITLTGDPAPMCSVLPTSLVFTSATGPTRAITLTVPAHALAGYLFFNVTLSGPSMRLYQQPANASFVFVACPADQYANLTTGACVNCPPGTTSDAGARAKSQCRWKFMTGAEKPEARMWDKMDAHENPCLSNPCSPGFQCFNPGAGFCECFDGANGQYEAIL